MQLNSFDWVLVAVSIAISFAPAVWLARRAGSSTAEFFTSGRAQPLSVLVASDFRFDLSPKLNALAMLIVLFNVAVIAASELLRRRPLRARAA